MPGVAQQLLRLGNFSADKQTEPAFWRDETGGNGQEAIEFFYRAQGDDVGGLPPLFSAIAEHIGSVEL